MDTPTAVIYYYRDARHLWRTLYVFNLNEYLQLFLFASFLHRSEFTTQSDSNLEITSIFNSFQVMNIFVQPCTFICLAWPMASLEVITYLILVLSLSWKTTLLKYQCSITQYWHCIGAALVLHQRFSGAALALHWHCIGTALVLHLPCIGPALEMLWSSFVTLESPKSCRTQQNLSSNILHIFSIHIFAQHLVQTFRHCKKLAENTATYNSESFVIK